MHNNKQVKDIMINIFDYPHIPYWFSINQAIRIIKVSFLNIKKYLEPIAILVFDEKYNLLGTVTIRDILKGLEATIFYAGEKKHINEELNAEESIDRDTLFYRDAKELMEKPVGDIMSPVEIYIEPNEPIKKAAYLMLSHNLFLLPVLENKKKLVGLVRMTELFDEISNRMMEEKRVLNHSPLKSKDA